MIDLVTKALVDHLLSRTSDLGASWVEISALDTSGPLTADKLQVCLYSIEEHDHLRNAPPVDTPRGWERAPLALRLRYVMTYVSNSHTEAQARLSRVLGVFHSTPVLGPAELPSGVSSQVERLTVRLLSPSDEERNNLWTAFGRGMRLALYYLVDVALVRPTEQDGDGSVRYHRVDYVEMPA